jgi:Tol biopolymer transport system component
VGVGDIYAIRPGVDSAAVELSATEFTEYSPALSPDDRWLAYVSDQSGQDEVYVIPFPEGRVSGGLVQVSANGRRFPSLGT